MNSLHCMTLFARGFPRALLALLLLTCVAPAQTTTPTPPAPNQQEEVKRAAPATAPQPKSKAEAKTDGPKISESAKALANLQPSRQRLPLAIPEVARDKVIGFALYTTHKGVLKLS